MSPRARWRCHLPLFLALPPPPRRSFPWKCACKICIPGTARAVPGIREKLSLNYESLKRLRARAVSRPAPLPPLPLACSPPEQPFSAAPARLVRPCIPVCRWRPGKRISSRKRRAVRAVMDTSVRCSRRDCPLAFWRSGPSDDGGARHPATTSAIFHILL